MAPYEVASMTAACDAAGFSTDLASIDAAEESAEDSITSSSVQASAAPGLVAALSVGVVACTTL